MDHGEDSGLRLTLTVFPHPKLSTVVRYQMWFSRGDNTERFVLSGECPRDDYKRTLAGIVWGVDWDK